MDGEKTILMDAKSQEDSLKSTRSSFCQSKTSKRKHLKTILVC